MFKNLICLTFIVCLNARLITSASILETLLADLGDFIQEQIDQRAAEDETYVLQYFDTKGRSEFIRWIFAYAGKQFVDSRVKTADWDQLKPTEPFLQLPILNVTRANEKIEIAQSKAIARYLARRFDLNGRTMNDEVFADMYGEQLGDLFNAWKNATDNKHPEAVYNDVYPQNLVFFEKRLIATGNGLLAGDEVTWADIYLSQMIDFIADKRDQVLKAFPHVKALDDRIRSHPNIKDYLKVRIDN